MAYRGREFKGLLEKGDNMPRYLISRCSICRKDYGKKELSPDYAKTGIASLDKGDRISHGLCSRCYEIEKKKLDKLIKEQGI